jgi:hypothetical protein
MAREINMKSDEANSPTPEVQEKIRKIRESKGKMSYDKWVISNKIR